MFCKDEQCAECGRSGVNVEIVTEQLYWGRRREPFAARFPVHHCPHCKAQWISWEGQREITRAQFRFEQRCKGMVRTRFASEGERQLWEEAARDADLSPY